MAEQPKIQMTSIEARRAILDGTAPEGLTVGGSLYLRGTAITALPDGLTVGGGLYLRGTAITALPDGLTVGGSLDLRGTAITALPDGLTVGGSLDLRGCANLKSGVYGSIIVPPGHSAGQYTVTGHLTPGAVVIRAECFAASLDEARARAGARKAYLRAIDEIESMMEAE